MFNLYLKKVLTLREIGTLAPKFLSVVTFRNRLRLDFVAAEILKDSPRIQEDGVYP
jgi:hypothetical protein